METTTGDRNTLAHVDLTSTVSQITWGSMAAAQYTNPVIALKEINDSYDVVTIDYVMSCVDGKGETEYYNVREYFRPVSYTHLRAHETGRNLVCRLLLEKKKTQNKKKTKNKKT